MTDHNTNVIASVHKEEPFEPFFVSCKPCFPSTGMRNGCSKKMHIIIDVSFVEKLYTSKTMCTSNIIP